MMSCAEILPAASSIFNDPGNCIRDYEGSLTNSLKWLVGNLTTQGKSPKSGSLVIPGSPVELVSINRNAELKGMIENVGSLVAFFEEQPSNEEPK